MTQRLPAGWCSRVNSSLRPRRLLQGRNLRRCLLQGNARPSAWALLPLVPWRSFRPKQNCSMRTLSTRLDALE